MSRDTRRGNLLGRHRQSALALVICAVAFGIVTPAVSEPAVKGDLAAWRELKAAFQRLNHLRSYRVRLSAPGGVKGTLEVMNPNRFHMIMEAAPVRIETIQVGKEVRLRQEKGWQCVEGSVAIPTGDPATVSGEITVARGTEKKFNGAPVQAYAYQQKSRSLLLTGKVYVAVRNGLPVRVEILDASGQVVRELDYYDYNAPIEITLPRCT